ncbi:helix-turn-helix transcriptional regulator [Lactobacillus terrae]|uniref:helix-turn-helix transcriptional regulator n=1 Tax=Lactobacillus terrae TaxID=2269374 RepID=UPI001FE449C2|nr:helix-turn-helix transcriptional regulator [Lactobacillus terrae]
MIKITTIEELRKSVSISQVEMANMLDISAKTLAKYEKDSSNLPTVLLKKYMDIFDVKFDDIFLGKKYEIIVQRKKKINL